MNSSILARDVRFMGMSAAMLAATLAAMLVIFVLAKPSQAADPILTIRPSSVDFGNVTVDADTKTRTITVENNGLIALELGGLEILGNDTGAFTTDVGPGGLTVGAGETATITATFDPVETGLETVQLTFNSVTDTLGGSVSGVELPTISLTGQGVSANPRGSGCTITGSNNSETLRGTPGKDVICALGGRDRVSALSGNDKVRGGRGNDVVRSSKGSDRLNGGIGADRLTDKAGKRGDKLFGQGGKDTLNAKDGRRGDLLNGGPRRDKAFKDRGDKARSI
jgi:Ca2+-binding RTX toxin-like protein